MKMIMGWIWAFVFVATLNAGEVDLNIKRMLDRNDVKYTIDSDNDFRVPFNDGNIVVVNSDLSTYKELTVREIWVVLGEVGKRGNTLMYRMLIENNTRKVGAYSMSVQNGKTYAVYKVILPAKASWDELWSAILFCSDIELPDEN